ncbi:hypothetical protein KJA15_00390 [Patescibacteria group bacterium]|nr:hypothetical protein [Patescibacteria group bacterium]
MTTKTLIVILIVGIIIIGGWFIYNSPFFIPIRYKLLRCPEGYKKFGSLSGPYCAPDSQKPCSLHTDCPEDERCISKDGKNWFCSGRWTGCYFWDPERPEEMLCAD